MSNQYILNQHDAVPVDDVLEWGRWFADADRRVADTSIGDTRVSTVFLGLDHQYGDGPPLLFETLVFGGKLDGEMMRYSTWGEAERGHKVMVRRVQG
jgi:hypothetical protein